MLRIWCEWDMGQEYIVFTSKEKAIAWVNNNVYFVEAFNLDTESDPAEEGQTIFEYYDGSGMIGIETLTVDPE